MRVLAVALLAVVLTVSGALGLAGNGGTSSAPRTSTVDPSTIQAGNGQNPARKASTDAGIPMSTPSFTLNKVCLSGLDAVALADQMIQAGEYDIVVAGGMESMTAGPHMLPKARAGYKYGPGKLIDATDHDGLTDAYDVVFIGYATERLANVSGISFQ